MNKTLSRREMLKISSIAGVTAIGGGVTCKAHIFHSTQEQKGFWPWPLNRGIPTAKAAETAYVNYYQHGCMYGVVTGVARETAEDLGPPYSRFPFEMLQYGAGGGELWGSLCGALNGGLAALALFVGDTKLRRKMANQLMDWYESTPQPQWIPSKPLRDVPKKLPRSISLSPLCHLSVSRWAAESGYDPFSPERSERCGRLTGSVAGFVAAQLNEVLINCDLTNRKELGGTAELCLECHGKGAARKAPVVLSRMDCRLCHDLETNKNIIPHR